MGHWSSQEHDEDKFCAGCGYLGCSMELASEIERLRDVIADMECYCLPHAEPHDGMCQRCMALHEHSSR